MGGLNMAKGGKFSGRSGLNAPDVRDVPMEIYALVDPRSCAVRYIGKSRNATSRLATHCSSTCGAANRVRAWVAELAVAGLRPHLVILHVVPPGEDAARAEGDVLRAFRWSQPPLLNRHYPFRVVAEEMESVARWTEARLRREFPVGISGASCVGGAR